jgi:hypothetical protein
MSLSFPANIAAECPRTVCCILGDIYLKKKLHVARTGRTKRRILGIFQKSNVLSEIEEHWLKKYCNLIFKLLTLNLPTTTIVAQPFLMFC